MEKEKEETKQILSKRRSVKKLLQKPTLPRTSISFLPCVYAIRVSGRREEKREGKSREKEREMEKLTWSRPVTFIEMIFKYFGTILRTFLSEIDESIGDLLQPCHVSSVSLFARFASTDIDIPDGRESLRRCKMMMVSRETNI